MTDREKEIKYLLYLKNELLKQTRKEIKHLNIELAQVQGERRLEKDNKRHGRSKK